jgi:hypothetical protein
MKKLLVIAATLAASSAFAGVKLEVRSDYVNTNKYDQADGNENGGNSLFTPAVARLYLNGNVGEAVVDSAWNLRAFVPEFVSDPGAAASGSYSKTMTVDTFVDHLWIGKGMDAWMFKAGKLEINAGGFEHQLDLHGNTYLTSMANGGRGGISTSGDIFGAAGYVTNPTNSSGVSAAYAINADNKLEFQVMNQTNSQTATVDTGVAETSTDRRHTMGLNYQGSYMEKMLQANVGYISGAGDTNSNGHEQTYINAGLRIAPMAALTVDLEYFANTDKNSTLDNTATTDSTIVEARYTTNGWTPVLKYEMSNNKNKDTNDIDWKRTAFAVALEYAPKADENFRYHVAYTSVKDADFGSAIASNDDMTKNMITIGLKYTGDMAK